MPTQKGFPPIGEVFFALCKATDTPVALGCWLRFKYSHLELANFDINPRDYLDSASFQADYQCVAFLSKYKGLDTGIDLEAVAMKKFTSSEAQCLNTNRRFRQGRNLGFSKPIEVMLHHVRRKIASLLGPFSVFKIEPGFGWGPGATDDVRRRAAFVDTKMCELPISCTRSALPLFSSVVRNDLHWSCRLLNISVEDLMGPFSFLDGIFSITDCCVIELVPKNAKTHRVIAKEPRANGFLQKGVGSYIRQRLKREGIDLDDQSANQRGAYFALRDGLATLDLRAASDTMSLEVVYDLLPIDWAMCLDDIRSKRALLPSGEKLLLEKISSMGNGFTFELETLVFYCIADVCHKMLGLSTKTLVYGDDIVCSKKAAKHLINMLGFIGFSVNPEKSFISGQFYESCGRQYFGEVDVTPAYQKEVVSSALGAVRIANRLIRGAARLAFGSGRMFNPTLISAWKVVRRYAIDRGDFYAFQIPLGTDGDEAFLVNGVDFRPVPSDVNIGFRCNVLRPPIRRLPADDRSLLAHALRTSVVTSSPYLGSVSVQEPEERGLCRIGHRWVMPTGEFGLDYDD